MALDCRRSLTLAIAISICQLKNGVLIQTLIEGVSGPKSSKSRLGSVGISTSKAIGLSRPGLSNCQQARNRIAPKRTEAIIVASDPFILGTRVVPSWPSRINGQGHRKFKLRGRKARFALLAQLISNLTIPNLDRHVTIYALSTRI